MRGLGCDLWHPLFIAPTSNTFKDSAGTQEEQEAEAIDRLERGEANEKENSHVDGGRESVGEEEEEEGALQKSTALEEGLVD